MHDAIQCESFWYLDKIQARSRSDLTHNIPFTFLYLKKNINFDSQTPAINRFENRKPRKLDFT